jgi:hypothetical protein
VLQNDSNPLAALTASTVLTNKPFSIYNWLGLLGSVKVLDTTLLPPVKIYIRLAPRTCLSTSGTPTSYSYQWTNVKGSIDIMDISDGVYYQMVAQKLQSSPLEIPFTNYTTIQGGSGSATQSLKFSTSANCVEMVLGTALDTGFDDTTHNTTTGLSKYFTRKGDTITSSQFFVNSVPYPSIPLDNSVGEVFLDTAHALGVAGDMVAQTNPHGYIGKIQCELLGSCP